MEIELFFLALVGFVAGVINIMAGGGSLLTLPMLIFLGLPPAIANGTEPGGYPHSECIFDFRFSK